MFGRPKRKDPALVEKEFKQELDKNGGVEKKDVFAMILSAMLVIVPICLLVLGGLALLCLGLFGLL